MVIYMIFSEAEIFQLLGLKQGLKKILLSFVYSAKLSLGSNRDD